MNRSLGAGHTGVPSVGFSADRHCLGFTLNGSVYADPDTPNFGENKSSTVQYSTAAVLWIGETLVSADSLKSRVAGLIASLDAAKEGLKRLIQTTEHVL